jgi:phosphatidylglycerophosphatase A
MKPDTSPWRVDALLSTGFGVGYLPKAPGTWGSLAALPFAWVIAESGGATALLAATAAVLLLGVWASGSFARRTGRKDPGIIIIDEVAGQWLTLAFVPADPYYYLAGFLLFRIADIVKPWPASWADRKLDGGIGVMLDDIFAGVYAAVMLFAAYTYLG